MGRPAAESTGTARRHSARVAPRPWTWITQVEDDAVHGGESGVARDLGQIAEIRLDQASAPFGNGCRQAKSATRDRGRIGVKAQEAPPRRDGLQHRRRMASAAQGAVDHNSAWPKRQASEDLGQHHWPMFYLLEGIGRLHCLDPQRCEVIFCKGAVFETRFDLAPGLRGP